MSRESYAALCRNILAVNVFLRDRAADGRPLTIRCRHIRAYPFGRLPTALRNQRTKALTLVVLRSRITFAAFLFVALARAAMTTHIVAYSGSCLFATSGGKQ